jgi:hypothetical protein
MTALFKITLATHHFCVSEVELSAVRIITGFAKRFVQYGFVRESGKNINTAIKAFAAATDSRSEYRFHINALSDFWDHLEINSIDKKLVTVVTRPSYEVILADLVVKPKWIARQDQQPMIDFLVDPDGPAMRLVALQTGMGKAQPLYANIKVPGGWSTMGEMEVGTVITARDGTPTKVTAIHPQGRKQVYKITFADGRKTEACAEHLWRVYYIDAQFEERCRAVNTLEVLRLISLPNPRVCIDLIESEDCPDIDLAVDPYTLGISDWSGSASFIPEEYLNASKAQRLGLLQGLMDKNARPNTRCVSALLTTTSYAIAICVQYLVRSLGGIASVSKIHDAKYGVTIQHKELSSLFRTSGKKKSVLIFDQHAASLKLGVVSVVASTVEECQCISVEAADHLYVTDDFIVTHNTFITMQAMSKICRRTVVIVKPGYMEKWVSDFIKTYEIGPEDVMTVSGGAQLLALLAMQQAGQLTQNLIIISNRTYQNWLSLYEANGLGTVDLGYACLPDQLFEFLQAGIRLVDETHQDFHLNFKMDLYTHVPLSISLSATLISNDIFMQRMYEVMFPAVTRAPVPALQKYIRALALVYRMKPGREKYVRTSEHGSTNYSHTAFEKSIMKSDSLQESYFEAIKFCLDATYMKKYIKGDKFIVFAASVVMCERIRDYLKEEYPSLKIRKFTQGDPMSHLLESDGAISTLGSAGTAHDIPGLTTVVQTTAVDSPQANVQSFGRLRVIPGRDVDFVFFSCVDIPKQMQYYARKKTMLEERAASFRTVNLPFMV